MFWEFFAGVFGMLGTCLSFNIHLFLLVNCVAEWALNLLRDYDYVFVFVSPSYINCFELNRS